MDLNTLCINCNKTMGEHYGPGANPICVRGAVPKNDTERFSPQIFDLKQVKRGTRLAWRHNQGVWGCTVTKIDNTTHSIYYRADPECWKYNSLSESHCASVEVTGHLSIIGQPPDLSTIKVGDRVEVVYFDKENVRTSKATVIKTTPEGSVTTVLDQPWNDATCKPWTLASQSDKKTLDFAKTLGFAEDSPSWVLSKGQADITFITRIIASWDNSNTEEKMTLININKLEKGDRVKVQIKDKEGFLYTEEGTVLLFEPAYGEVHIYLDSEVDYVTIKSHLAGNIGQADVDATHDLNLTQRPRVVKFAANHPHIRVTKVLSKASEKKDFEKKDTGKEKEMTEAKKETGFVDMLKADAGKAAWRTGATQVSNAAQAGILLMLKERHGMDDSKLAIVREALATEAGNALIRYFLGSVLTHVPGIKEDPRAKQLGEEFRVSGMAKGMDELVGTATIYLMPGIQAAIQALPPIQEAIPAALKPRTRKRVATSKRVAAVPEAIPVHVEEEAAEIEAATA